MMKKKVKSKKIEPVVYGRCCQHRTCHFCGTYVMPFEGGDTFSKRNPKIKHLICRGCLD